MDIKDVSDFPPPVGDVGQPSRVQNPGSASSQTNTASTKLAANYDELTISAPRRAPEDLRKLNDAIEATNLATEAVSKMGTVLDGIEATLTPSSNSEDFNDLTAALDRKAREKRDNLLTRSVAAEITRGAAVVSADSIRLELEATLGKTLEMILPSGSTSASGVDVANLSPKDLILDTVAKVEAARKGIEELRTRLALGIGILGAVANPRAGFPGSTKMGSSKLRDVEQVWTTAREARNEITGQPERALGVVGDLQRNAPALLR